MSASKRLKKFWWYVNERHRIYKKKSEEDPWPWTDDEILQTYKFTNVYRELDAETLRFRSHIDPLPNGPDKLYRMILYRAFNIESTYRALTRSDKDRTPKQMLKILQRRTDQRKQIFTGAYIITNAGSETPKIELMSNAMGVAYRGRRKLWEEMMADGTMQGCTDILREYPMQGPFTAYEVICDMRHQKGMLDKAPDRRKWANLGPGARRGINRIVSGKKKPNVFPSVATYIEFMQELLKSSKPNMGKHMTTLEMREIEHSLCEFDKYLRVAAGEGRPRSIYRRPS